MKILGMGNALVDVLAQIENDEILEQLNLPKGSMTLIDEERFSEFSKMFETMKPSIVSGGSASNTIIGLSTLGILSGFLGRIGSDLYGEIYKKDLEKYNVCPHLIEADEVSGVASTFISKDGERTFGTYLGAAAKMEATDLSSTHFEGYDYFYIEGYLLQNHALIENALKMAKQQDMIVALDMASFNIVEENKEFLLKIIPQYIDIVFANKEEAKAFTGLEAEQAVSELIKLTTLAIVKDGENGSWIQQGASKIHIPANKVSEVIDTTGAGDLYAAGFLYGLAKDKTLKDCGSLGTLLAGEVIQCIGPKISEERWEVIRKKLDK